LSKSDTGYNSIYGVGNWILCYVEDE